MKMMGKPRERIVNRYGTGLMLLAVVWLIGVCGLALDGTAQEAEPPPGDDMVVETIEIIPAEGAGEVEAAAVEVMEAEGDLVSVSVTEGRIQDVLRSLAAMRPGTTIMIDPEVAGIISFELQQVPWETALFLIADAHGLEIEQRSENVFMAKPAAEEVDEADLLVEVYSAEEIAELPEDLLLTMYESYKDIPVGMTVEEVRAQMKARPHFYLKRLSVTNRKAIEVINRLARTTNVDFVFSTHFESEPKEGEERTRPVRSGYDEGPPISLNIRNRPVPAAIRLVAEQGGLSAVHQDDIWIVKPMRPEQRQLEPLISRTFRVRYIAVDDKLIADLQKLSSGRGQIIARGKTLTVFDTAANIEQIERVITDQDIPIPQVLIEARFFVLTDTTSQELGIDWQSFTDREDSGINFGADFHNLTYEYWDLGRVLDPRTATLSLPRLNTVLHALHAMDKAEQLSNPKILVSSGEQATIHIGRQEPILRSTVAMVDGEAIRTYELDTNFGGETVRVADLLADRSNKISHESAYAGYTGYLDLGTKLTVAPEVKTEDEVYIRVIPELINKPGEITVGEDAFRQSFPELYRVRVQTQFTLRSGQTIAIGGLVSEDMETKQKGIPGLQRLPLAGRLFRYDTENTVRSETIIFLTVRVIAPEQMDTVSGMPISSRDAQPAIDRIREQDAAGATYNEEKRREEWRQREEQTTGFSFTPRFRSTRSAEPRSWEVPADAGDADSSERQGIIGVEVDNLTPAYEDYYPAAEDGEIEGKEEEVEQQDQ